MDSGLLYAEGYTCPRGGIPAYSAWCLDGETVVDPGSSEPGTAYFGVALRSDYMRRNYEAHRFADGTDGFRQVSPRNDNAVVDPPVDPAADIVWDFGRDIPPWVREWGLTAEPRSGGDPVAPPWVLDELLGFGDVRASKPAVLALLPPAEGRAPDSDAGPQGQGRTGGVSSDDGVILDEIKDGDSLDTLIRMADEYRPRCEWARCPADERENPELTVDKRAEVHLKWTRGRLADHDFAVLHRLDYQVWDAWLHPVRLEGVARVIDEPPELLTRNGVSYEMALAEVFEVMGDQMPERFRVLYL